MTDSGIAFGRDCVTNSDRSRNTDRPRLMLIIRSLAFNIAFYVNLIVQMLFWSPWFLPGAAPACLVRAEILGALQSVAAGEDRRHQERDHRRREPAGGFLHPGAQAPVLLGRDRLLPLPARSALHPEARTDLDPVLRLVRHEDADDPDQSRHAQQGAEGRGGWRQARNGQRSAS